jgi:glucose-6-phosphate 1-dehydrogenase
LPEPFAIIGFARREWDDEAFREHLRDIVRQKRLFHEALWQKFARGLRYVQGDFTSPAHEAYATLREKLIKIQAERYIPDNILGVSSVSTVPAQIACTKLYVVW